MIAILKSRLYQPVLLLLIILVFGVSGYMILSDATFVDALYMTIITMTTVGFGEIHPFTEAEKIFTIVLILTSISVFGYTVSLFTEFIISGKLSHQLKQKKVQKKIHNLNNHSIICGFGRNGKQAVVKLENYNKDFVIVEKDIELLEELESKEIPCVKGDATIDETLQEAGIERASSLITALPSDADNLFVVLTARQLNKDCKIISRASNESSYNKLKIAGADNVIMPDKLGGAHMASLVVTPDVIEFVDRLTFSGDTTTNLEEISVDDLPEKYLNKTILDLDLRNQTGCTVIGFKGLDNDYVINPEANSKLEAGTHLIVLGRPEQITKLRELF